MEKRKYFSEYSYMHDFITKNNIKKWSYDFTFSYGYCLTYELPEEK